MLRADNNRIAGQSIASEKLAENRYDAGLQDYLSFLEAQRNSFTAQSELISANRQRLDARVDLYLALGGDYATTQQMEAIP